MSEGQKKSVNLPPIKKAGENEGDDMQEKWVKKNWKKVEKDDLKKLHPMQQSRYLAYEDAPKVVTDAQDQTKQRLREAKKKEQRAHQAGPHDEMTDKDKHEKLIGQLKAAEARNRIRIMRLRYEANRGQEINHLIMCQPNARKAVRLQALLPAKPENRNHGDTIDKMTRDRIEILLEDPDGVQTRRT